MADWGRIATRTRVPLGFLFAAVYVFLAGPTWTSISIGCLIALAGVAVRAAASGHIRKNSELTTTGPYAYTRNPLYLGSILIAAGFIVAALSWWVALAALGMFVFIYVPVVSAEEKYLRSTFSSYGNYAAHVPRFLPRPFPYAAPSDSGKPAGKFSRQLYMKHREYNALLGSVLMFGALILKMVWVRR